MSLLLAPLWWNAILPAALQATPLLLLAACLDLLMPALVSPRWRAAMWLLAASKLLVPVSFGVLPANSSEPSPLVAWGLPWLWFAGTAVLAAGGALWVWRSVASWRQGALAEHHLLERVEALASALGLAKAPRVLVSRTVPGPLVFGRTLYWPAALSLSAAERDQALRHELTHLKRHDGWRAAGWVLLVALFWFHPLVWWAASRMRALREQCCDQTAAHLPGHDVESYRSSLLRVLAWMTARPYPGLAFVDPRAPLQHRLSLLRAGHQGSRRKVAAFACVVAILALWPVCGWAQERAAATAEWIARPPGSLQLRYMVLERLANQQ